MKIFGTIIFSILVTFLQVLMKGYTLSILWSWFIVSVFTLPILTIPTALGLSLIVKLLTHPLTKKDWDKKGVAQKDAAKSIWESFLFSLFKCVAVLAIGYLITLFM